MSLLQAAQRRVSGRRQCLPIVIAIIEPAPTAITGSLIPEKAERDAPEGTTAGAVAHTGAAELGTEAIDEERSSTVPPPRRDSTDPSRPHHRSVEHLLPTDPRVGIVTT